jgi:hypothetical protein
MTIVIIVGAGFSLDANQFVSSHRTFTGYVGQLARVCFDSHYDLSAGVEAAFTAAVRLGDHKPVERLGSARER